MCKKYLITFYAILFDTFLWWWSMWNETCRKNQCCNV